MIGYVEKMWNEYASMVIEPHVSAEDRAEFKQVFFTGAAAVFAIMMAELGDDEATDENYERKAQMAAEIHAELRDWALRSVDDLKEQRRRRTM